MNQKALNEFNKHRKFYEEIAERRTIEFLGLSKKEIAIGKAFASTKAVELDKLEEEFMQREAEHLTLRKVLFGKF